MQAAGYEYINLCALYSPRSLTVRLAMTVGAAIARPTEISLPMCVHPASVRRCNCVFLVKAKFASCLH